MPHYLAAVLFAPVLLSAGVAIVFAVFDEIRHCSIDPWGGNVEPKGAGDAI